MLCLTLAPSASAAFEQAGTFAGSATPVSEAEFKEEVQLGGVGGMAVNVSGAGGVPAGTVYAAGRVSGEGVQVSMFKPKPGGLDFSLSWEVTIGEGSYERCGPALGTECSKRVGGLPAHLDVEVDQTTGNVYVFNSQAFDPGKKAIVVYKPDGSAVIARFGEMAAEGKTTAETPGLIHSSPYSAQLAVTDTGEVFVFDLNFSDGFYRRLMVFKPQSPGDFEHYVYAGEVAAGSGGQEHSPTHPVSDAAGNIYTLSSGIFIDMRAPEAPAAYPATSPPPVCSYEFAKGGIESLAVDPTSGEVFFYSYKNPKRVRRLGPCDEATGKFTETSPEPEAFTVTPERGDLSAMTFDPVREAQAGRGPGTLYAGAPDGVPGSGVGKGEPGQSSLGYIFEPVPENEPTVGGETVAQVRSRSAQLRAEVDPEGFRSRYVFQYLSEAAFEEGGESYVGALEAPLGGGEVGEGTVSIAVGDTVTGLQPETEYRFRVIATSHCKPSEPEEVCESVGAGAIFSTFPEEGTVLPDGRAYELVSPALKHGGQVAPADPRVATCPGECFKPGEFFSHFPMQSTADGEAIVYEGSPFGPGEGAATANQYRARRTASGWQSQNLTPPLLSSAGSKGYKAFSADLERGLLEQQASALPLAPQAPAEYDNLYSQPAADPLALGPLLTAPAPNRPPVGTSRFEILYAGASADLSRTFFAANDALTEASPFAPSAPVAPAGKFNLYEWEPASAQLRLVNVAPGNATAAAGAAFGTGSAHAISSDGSRVFWSDEAGQVFVREDAEQTREIPDSGKFLAAATDGSKVLLANGHLYDLEAETTTDLTAGAGGFVGLLGQSDDLTHVYFVDTAVLSGEEENSEGDKAKAAQNNLYEWNEGTIRFVAGLVAADNKPLSVSPTSDWAPAPSDRSAQASPGGGFLAFLSKAPLTGYDNTGPCETDHAGGFVPAPCAEVFLYDSASGKLRCASCNPSGVPPLGWSLLRLINAPSYLPQAHYLTDAGRLLFDSHDSLSQADTNEGFEDVYELELTGVGGCGREEGCLSLISGGRETVDSNFLAMDTGGKNVFFTTRERLVGADTDDLVDLYDAREGGGFAAAGELPPKPCQGEGCQPAPPAPAELPPSSTTLNDPGNVKPLKCKKGQVKKQGKCVKKHKPKKAKAAKKHGGSK